MSIILLVDNGSTKAAATLQLRKIAQQLGDQVSQKIYPVSLQHADGVSAEELSGVKAWVFASFLREKLQRGYREFFVLPLFFGNSRALTAFIPDIQVSLQKEFGNFSLKIAQTLFPLPFQNKEIDGRLVDIIYDHIKQSPLPLKNIVLVDHGSPSPHITAVRNAVAEGVQAKLGDDVLLEQAVMERREGKEYDFNGELLEDWLSIKAQQGETSAIVVLLFSLPGRHAGADGDIVVICDSVMKRYPNFKIHISPLVGKHPLLFDILADRLNSLEACQVDR